MNIAEKSAYLKGLMEGMEYDTTTKEGKLFTAIIDLLSEIADSVLDLDDENAVVNDYLDELDTDLGAVEEVVYGADECECCDDDECCCEDEDEEDDDEYDNEDEDEDDEATEFRALECPHCGEDVYIDNSFEDDEIVCPHCFEMIKVDEAAEDEKKS